MGPGFVITPAIVFSQCIHEPDGPDCPCFDDTGAWAPAGAFIQDIALQTVGTRNSCIDKGGKPYYQMVLGCNSEPCALLVSWALSTLEEEDGDLFNKRVWWCSESISYWHREAGIPYSGGYRTAWHGNWQCYSVGQLKEWYTVEEAAGGRGRWLAAEDVDYENFELGVTVPVPGAYVAMRSFTYGSPPASLPHWLPLDDSHSLMINEMWIHRNLSGKVVEVEVSLVEGNSGARVRDDRHWDDIMAFTPQGSEWLSSGRKIYGFGIDLDSGGDLIYDPSRLHDDTHHLVVKPPIYVKTSDPDWAIFSKDLPKLMAYAKVLADRGGPEINCSLPSVKVSGIPDGRKNFIQFPEFLGSVALDMDLLEESPKPIKGILMKWNPSFVPRTFEVQFAGIDGEYQQAIMPDLQDVVFPGNIPYIPVAAKFLKSGDGVAARYIKLYFPKGTFQDAATLEELTLLYDHGSWEDSGENDFSSPSSFKRGDVDGNGTLELTDAVRFLNYAFVGIVQALECMDAADVDDNGELDIADVIRLLNYQFTGSAPAPELPGPFQCGPDGNGDAFPDCVYPPVSCK